MLRKICLFCSLSLLLLACDKEDDQLLFQISPQNEVVYSLPGNDLAVQLAVHSTEELERLVVVKRWESGASEILTTKILEGKELSYTYTLAVPEFATASFQLIFTVYTTENNSRTQVLTVSDYSNTTLTEKGPYTLKSYFSEDGQNGFLIENLELVAKDVALQSAGSVLEADLTDDGLLSQIWTTGGDVVFTSDSTFDYANASPAKIAAAVGNGAAQIEVEEGSILLLRYGQEGSYNYASIRIAELRDLPGSEDDGYVFYIKK